MLRADVHEANPRPAHRRRVLICPGNRHMMVRRMPRGEMVVLSDTPPINGHRPSADVLFHSVAQEFGLTSVGIIMTGMGEDGAEGIGAIKAAGGMTIAQSERNLRRWWNAARRHDEGFRSEGAASRHVGSAPD